MSAVPVPIRTLASAFEADATISAPNTDNPRKKRHPRRRERDEEFEDMELKTPAAAMRVTVERHFTARPTTVRSLPAYAPEICEADGAFW